jgi:hypothetical protein
MVNLALCVFFFFGGTGVSTQVLMLARQALYHLNHSAGSPMTVLLSLFILIFYYPRFGQGIQSN